MKLLVFDPGNSTGWVFYDSTNGYYTGGTIVEDFDAINQLIVDFEPTLVIYETFALYPSMAQHMSWNTFYPVEVIGVIKYACQKLEIKILAQAASVKKFSGGVDDNYGEIKRNSKFCPGTRYRGDCTEHTKDAYLHLRYYLRNNANG